MVGRLAPGSVWHRLQTILVISCNCGDMGINTACTCRARPLTMLNRCLPSIDVKNALHSACKVVPVSVVMICGAWSGLEAVVSGS
jgi:hypothetical protein